MAWYGIRGTRLGAAGMAMVKLNGYLDWLCISPKGEERHQDYRTINRGSLSLAR